MHRQHFGQQKESKDLYYFLATICASHRSYYLKTMGGGFASGATVS